MSEPLYIWSDNAPTPEQLEILKAAKQATGLDILVRPARATPGCGRCLVFGPETPPFFCDWANTAWDDPKLTAKIKWVLTGEGGRPHTGLEWMQSILGPETKEADVVDYTGGVAFK